MKDTSIETHHSNRQKLVHQNTKLNREIRLLEQKMSKVITDNIIKDMEDQQRKNKTENKMQELVVQENYIKKLKAKLQQLKALNITEVTKGIRDEENQLKVLKRQYEELMVQKQTMNKMYKIKQTHLQYNEPLNEVRGETTEELSKLKKKNIEMQGKVVQLQRQIRKYHKYQQLQKSYKNQSATIQNVEYESKKIDHDRQNWVKKTKLVEHKWKPQIQALDNQYFAEKGILQRKQKIVVQAEKELKIWQARASASRNQADVLLDRERISKVVTYSPKKNRLQNGNRLPKSPKSIQKKKEFTGFADVLKQFKQTLKDKKKETQEQVQRKWSNQMNQSNYGTQSERMKNNTEAQKNATRISQQGKFRPEPNKIEVPVEEAPSQKEEQSPKKKNVMMNSVGVGTSFYYNEDED